MGKGRTNVDFTLNLPWIHLISLEERGIPGLVTNIVLQLVANPCLIRTTFWTFGLSVIATIASDRSFFGRSPSVGSGGVSLGVFGGKCTSLKNSGLEIAVIGLVFLAPKVAFSQPSVDRFGKFFWGLMILGQVKSIQNFC